MARPSAGPDSLGSGLLLRVHTGPLRALRTAGERVEGDVDRDRGPRPAQRVYKPSAKSCTPRSDKGFQVAATSTGAKLPVRTR